MTRAWLWVLLFGLVAVFFYFQPVVYEDWAVYFRRAAADWCDPFVKGVYNAPWLFVLLHPLAVLPSRVGAALVMTLSVAIVMIYLRSPWRSLAVLLSAPMIGVFTLGQVDALPMMGLLVPATWSLPLLALKPQGIALAGLRRLSPKSLAVVVWVLILSFLAWGVWPLRFVEPGHMVASGHNISLFPYLVLPGLALVYLGLRLESDALLCWATVCLTPYLAITSLLPAMAATVKETQRWYIWAAVWLVVWALMVFWIIRWRSG